MVRDVTQLSMATIGEEFGGRDHSTVVYAIQQVERNEARFKMRGMVQDIIKTSETADRTALFRSWEEAAPSFDAMRRRRPKSRQKKR